MKTIQCQLIILETAYDKLTAISQELQEQVDRSLKISRTNTMTVLSLLLVQQTEQTKFYLLIAQVKLLLTQELGTFKGNWAASTTYAARDLVKDTSTNNIFVSKRSSYIVRISTTYN